MPVYTYTKVGAEAPPGEGEADIVFTDTFAAADTMKPRPKVFDTLEIADVFPDIQTGFNETPRIGDKPGVRVGNLDEDFSAADKPRPKVANLDDGFQVADVFPPIRTKLFDTYDVADLVRVVLGADYLDEVATADTPRIKVAALAEAFAISDFLRLRPVKVFDTLSFGDGTIRVKPKLSAPENVNARESRLVFAYKGAGNAAGYVQEGTREGVADDDKGGGDTFTDEGAPNANNGGAAFLEFNSNGIAPPVANRRRAYFRFDFTTNFFTDVVASADPVIVFRFWARNNDLAVDRNGTLYARVTAANPFGAGINENELNWNNQPAIGVSQGEFTMPGGNGINPFSMNLDASRQVEDVLGNYLQLMIRKEGALNTGLAEVRSKESGTTTERPQLRFEIARTV